MSKLVLSHYGDGGRHFSTGDVPSVTLLMFLEMVMAS
jgi:hypothetical protein